jgi:hypothetical protein
MSRRSTSCSPVRWCTGWPPRSCPVTTELAWDAVGRAGQPVTDLVLARLAGQPRPSAYLDDARLADLTSRALHTAVAEMLPAGTRGPGAPAAAVGHTRVLRRLARLADGRTVFVKAAGPGADLSAELTAYEAIGAAPFMPQALAVSRDPAPLLALEVLPADGWITSWTSASIADAKKVIAQVHAVPASAALPRWTDPGIGGPSAWLVIARDQTRLLRMHVCSQQWLSANLEALTEAASQAGRSGDRLVHGDLHAANLCYHQDRLVLADWATAAAGDPWFDTHDWLVALAAEGGPPPDERQGPGAVGHTALIAGTQALLVPSRDSDPVLFDIRRQRLAVARAWAARLLGLPPPDAP